MIEVCVCHSSSNDLSNFVLESSTSYSFPVRDRLLSNMRNLSYESVRSSSSCVSYLSFSKLLWRMDFSFASLRTSNFPSHVISAFQLIHIMFRCCFLLRDQFLSNIRTINNPVCDVRINSFKIHHHLYFPSWIISFVDNCNFNWFVFGCWHSWWLMIEYISLLWYHLLPKI